MLPHHAVSADDKTFKVHPFNHVSSKHPVPHGVLTIPITASWVPSSSSARPEHGILVPETFNYKTMLPSSTSDLTSFGLVRSSSNQGKMYFIFYAVDDVTMWALPCNQKGVTWARLSKRMMPAIPNQPQLDAAAVSLVQRVVVQRELATEARRNEYKRRQTEAKRAAAAAEMHKERIKQRKVFCITVGRGSQHGILGSAQWVCWDGMENHGYGVVLSEAPTGRNRLQSRATDASGAPSISWTSSYVPTMALYHRHSP